MQEFGRTPVCLCHVLALLGDGEAEGRATLRAAAALAERSNARLTLAKTCEAGRAYVWIAPFAVGAAYLPPELDSPEQAAQVLTRLAAEVPPGVPLTTVVLTRDPQRAVLKLLGERHYGAIVVEAADLARWRRLRRQLRRLAPTTVVVSTGVESDDGSRPSGAISPRGRAARLGLKRRSAQPESGIRSLRSAEVNTTASAARSRSRSTGSSA
ncbi:MAG TPA: universal stress protein [Solirubrobacteraceae bacterium]|nr:universal stress protein [Solirubrobacteraceae bacterium]